MLLASVVNETKNQIKVQLLNDNSLSIIKMIN